MPNLKALDVMGLFDGEVMQIISHMHTSRVIEGLRNPGRRGFLASSVQV